MNLRPALRFPEFRLPAGLRGLYALVGLILAGAALVLGGCKGGEKADEFTRLTNLGRSQLEQGDGPKAVGLFQQALRLNPNSVEAHLNLANACLLANQPAEAIRETEEVLRLDH